MTYLLVFLSMIGADVAWTLYFIETGKRRAVQAGAWSAAIVAVGSFSTINYIHNPKTILAAIAGAFVGTYATIWWQARK